MLEIILALSIILHAPNPICPGYGDNDSAPAATSLPLGVSLLDSVRGADQDWFRLPELTAGRVYQVDVAPTEAGDPFLFVTDARGPSAGGEVTRDDDLSTPACRAGDWASCGARARFQIRPGQQQPLYALVFSVAPTATLGCQAYRIQITEADRAWLPLLH